jgi:hypothetical protein
MLDEGPREPEMENRNCQTCRAPLCGRQRKFCCRRCKNGSTNHKHQNYAAQMARGSARKTKLVAMCGGKCSQCGYNRNSAALSWHHLDPALKSFELDLRNLSNRRMSAILDELSKCILVCANCHAELHFPHFSRDSHLPESTASISR